MTKFKLKTYLICSSIFSIILGTILHFSFDWFNNSIIVGAFSAINESTWEHMKIAFYPMFISTILGFFLYNKTYPNFLCSKTIGLLLGLTFIPTFFYTYTGIIGKNYAVLDISIFIIAIILNEFVGYKLIHQKYECNNKLFCVILVLLLLCFIIFTYLTPKINIFRDPIDGNYGISILL